MTNKGRAPANKGRAPANKGRAPANKGMAQANKGVAIVIWLGDFYYRFMIYPVFIFKDF